MSDSKEKNVISLYIPKYLIQDEGYHYSILLYPFWGVQNMKDRFASIETFKRQNFDSSYYSLTEDSDSADYVFLPYSYWYLMRRNPKLISLYMKEARLLNKPLLIDAIGDSMKEITIPNSVVLRYASYRKILKDNDVIVPVFSDDLLVAHKGGELIIKEKSKKPIIGFSGWVSFTFLTLPRSYIRNAHLLFLGMFIPYFRARIKGIFLRKKVLNILKKSKLIVPNFQERESYSGNSKTAKGDVNILRREFVQNILESDYTLCIRGDSNQSTRFFEVLSLGRIPIFVDTDIPLPLEDKINYKEFCIFVDYRDIDRIDKIINEFHNSISFNEFENMQRKARKAYEMYLRMDVYTKYLMEILKEKSKNKA